MTEMPGAFRMATDDVPFADDSAGTPGVRLKLLMANVEGGRVAIGDAASRLRDWPAALREQGKTVPESRPIGGSMRYRPL